MRYYLLKPIPKRPQINPFSVHCLWCHRWEWASVGLRCVPHSKLWAWVLATLHVFPWIDRQRGERISCVLKNQGLLGAQHKTLGSQHFFGQHDSQLAQVPLRALCIVQRRLRLTGTSGCWFPSSTQFCEQHTLSSCLSSSREPWWTVSLWVG